MSMRTSTNTPVAGLGTEAVPAGPAAVRAQRRHRVLPSGLVLLARLALLGVCILAWHLVAANQWIDPTVTSAPGAVADWFSTAMRTSEFWSNLWATLSATLIAWVLASIAGIVIGLSLALLPWVERVVNPFLSALNAMPRIALAPLFVMAFGLTINAKIALAFSLVVFIAISAARAGVMSVDRDLTRLAEVLGATRRQRFVKILVPVAIPSIFGGLRLGLIYALLGTVTAELIGSVNGLGQQLQSAASLFETDVMYGLLIVLAIVAAVINTFMELLERRLLRWQS